MKAKRFGSRFIVRIDKGEEIIETLIQFCKDNGIKLGTVQGIGATNKAVIGLFDAETKKYHSNELRGNHEIAPLLGNISTMDGEVYLHIHVNLCDQEHNSFGGHLNSAVVSATFEAVIDVIDGEIDRKFSDEIGLNLYKL
ncbi:MAG: DNA-binding protein [Candidatus Altiarchaeales archaeon WOR_SM1_86-2]|nr:MAG: DNA-binding protein [Candidatus Altiarchaeales archaeon WOR_SM1_86-2]